MQKTTMPYEYQEYPRPLHHPEPNGPASIVTLDAERDAALDDGYTLAPPQAEPSEKSAPPPRRGRRASPFSGRVDPSWPTVLIAVFLCLGWARCQ